MKRKRIKLECRGHTATVKWSEDDQAYCGLLDNTGDDDYILIGDNEKDLYKKMDELIDLMKGINVKTVYPVKRKTAKKKTARKKKALA